ncbi:protein IMPACT isoform X2 [Pangasianodon hypophthalmus]|uniref:protein IMPACT isoform X2 n=1 Tax=Pangasianodon hypophthalmus TaxID=310915 RepID=UPI0023078AD6|nr:protein IMPACT isoform X2 [Pangasianodon hypophthalmus]
MDTITENGGDLQRQVEEIEALSSIYGEEWCVIDEASRVFCIKISDDISEPRCSVCLQVILPEDYPSSSPPIYQINAAWLRGPDRITLSNSLEELYLENPGESILYLWVEKIREFLVDRSQNANTDGLEPRHAKMTEEQDDDWDEGEIPDYGILRLSSEQAHLFSISSAGTSDSDEELPKIKHGEAITDRRSTFQPHLALVVTPKQVQRVLDKLYENKKIASATHNIYAYRIYCEDKNTFLQDCEDDGETAAGGRLLHLLQILDVRNVLVVVSRWYGGILLGPDRFKHINNCARSILVQEGYTETLDEASKPGGKSKKPKSKKMK